MKVSNHNWNNYLTHLENQDLIELQEFEESFHRIKATSRETIGKEKTSSTLYPSRLLMTAQGRRVCSYNMDGKMTC